MRNSSSVLVSLYTQENISEKHLKIFYKNSQAQRTLRMRERVLKKFLVHTAEQAEMFENMLEIVYKDSYIALRKQHPSLTGVERIILAFMHIELSEAKICRNMGITLEELRREQFIISKKLKTTVVDLRELIHSLL